MNLALKPFRLFEGFLTYWRIEMTHTTVGALLAVTSIAMFGAGLDPALSDSSALGLVFGSPCTLIAAFVCLK